MGKKSKASRDGIYIRGGAFYISWTDAQGHRRRRKTSAQTITQARLARDAERLRVEQAKALGFTPAGKDTFPEVSKRYLAHQRVRLTGAAYERERGIVEHHLNRFFLGPIAAIRRVDIQRYVTSRASDVSPHSVLKELNVLKHLLNLAVEWDIIPHSPAHGVKSPRVPAGRVRYLQPTELRALLETSPNWLRPIVALAVSTGMRRGEILGLRWIDIDRQGKRILLPQTKNGEGRIVYLNNLALQVIDLMAKPDAASLGKVFEGVTPEQVSLALLRTCRKLGIHDFRFHDLRHTAASWLRMQGADIHTVASLLGHKDLKMATRYQHLSPTFLGDAVNRLDGVFGLLPESVTSSANESA